MLVSLIMEVTLVVLNNLQLNLPYGLLHLSCVQEKYIDSSTSSQDQGDPTKVCFSSCQSCEGHGNCRVCSDSRKLGEKTDFMQLYSWNDIH